jgi:hypothetical protein
VDSIIERSSAELQSIHRRNIGFIRQAISNRNTQLSAVLSPEQQQLFEQIEKERKWESPAEPTTGVLVRVPMNGATVRRNGAIGIGSARPRMLRRIRKSQ